MARSRSNRKRGGSVVSNKVMESFYKNNGCIKDSTNKVPVVLGKGFVYDSHLPPMVINGGGWIEQPAPALFGSQMPLKGSIPSNCDLKLYTPVVPVVKPKAPVVPVVEPKAPVVPVVEPKAPVVTKKGGKKKRRGGRKRRIRGGKLPVVVNNPVIFRARGPVNAPNVGEAQFRQFNQSSEYIPLQDLSYNQKIGASSLMPPWVSPSEMTGPEIQGPISGFDVSSGIGKGGVPANLFSGGSTKRMTRRSKRKGRKTRRSKRQSRKTRQGRKARRSKRKGRKTRRHQ